MRSPRAGSAPDRNRACLGSLYGSPARAAALAVLVIMGCATPGVAQSSPSPEGANADRVSEVPAPAAPIRIALQAGHWRAAEAPEELARIRTNGSMAAGRHEWEVTLEIARLAGSLLEAEGYEVEILPATIPPGYRADLFIAIHADAFHSAAASGFSVGTPRRDATGQAAAFASILAGRYREASGLRHRIATRRMQGYYAFNSRRYHHSLDPRTVAVILEAGFLTSPSDRQLLFHAPDRLARGIADAVVEFLPRTLPRAGESAGEGAGEEPRLGAREEAR